MDAGLLVFEFVGAPVLFAALTFAKDRDGKRYGVKRMALLWLAALPYFLSSAFELNGKFSDGSSEKVSVPYSTWFLLCLPFVMIGDNIARRKKANQQPPVC